MTARIGDIELVASGYGFTLEDSQGVPALIFAYLDEQRARDAANLLRAVLVDAVVFPAAGF